jgi:hypothetical protein
MITLILGFQYGRYAVAYASSEYSANVAWEDSFEVSGPLNLVRVDGLSDLYTQI